MRRLMLVVVVAVTFSTASACITPSGYRPIPPILQSAEMSTTQVSAGSTFTVHVAATDDQAVANVGLRFRTPGMEPWETLNVPCDKSQFDSQQEISVDFPCTMPPIAANGDWILTVLVTDAVGLGPEGSCSCDSADIHFTVTGGTADTQGPQVEAFTTSPAPVTVGEPFDLTISLSDEHLAPDYSVSTFEYYSNDPFQVCTRASDRSVSATEHEWTFRCPPPTKPGTYFGGTFVPDAMGYVTNAHGSFNVVAAT